MLAVSAMAVAAAAPALLPRASTSPAVAARSGVYHLILRAGPRGRPNTGVAAIDHMAMGCRVCRGRPASHHPTTTPSRQMAPAHLLQKCHTPMLGVLRPWAGTAV